MPELPFRSVALQRARPQSFQRPAWVRGLEVGQAAHTREATEAATAAGRGGTGRLDIWVLDQLCPHLSVHLGKGEENYME